MVTKRHKTLLILTCFLLVPALPAQESVPADSAAPAATPNTAVSVPSPDTAQAAEPPNSVVAPAMADTILSEGLNLIDTAVVIPRLDFAGTSLFDALTALARAYNLSLYIDSSVTGHITLRLDNVTLNDALLFIIEEYHLEWRKTGNIIKIFRPVPPPPEPEPLRVTFEDGLLSVDLADIDLNRFVDTLIELTGQNIILEDRVQGKVTGKLKAVPPDQAMRVLLPANGFSVREMDQVLYVGRNEGSERQSARGLNARCDDGKVTIEASNVSLADVIAALSRECNISILVQAALEGSVTAQFADKPVEEALTYLLMNTNYTFSQSGDVIFVGNRTSQDLFDSRLIPLEHLIASSVEPLIPVSIGQQLTIKVVPEHNGFLATGPRTAIMRLENFLKQVDLRPAQVLFEVLVVDYTTTENTVFRLTGNNSAADQDYSQTYWPNLDLKGDGNDVNNALRSLERRMDWSNLGLLDDDFFVRLEIMEKEGKAVVQSHPQIATLNGHSASIKIGTTQYYLLESETIYPSQQSDLSKQTSQRFETIEADMSLVVTPYVSQSGDLIVEIAPEFTTPTGDLSSEVPPTLNRRVLKSTVRLKHGETIVLGGLIQNTKSQAIDKVPILGDIPLLGRLFQNRKSDDTRSELMIYVTPYVHYGSEGAIDTKSLHLMK